MSEETYRLDDVRAIRATDKAIMIRLLDDSTCWVPQSQVHADSEVWKVRDEGTLVVSQWFADKQGMDVTLAEAKKVVAIVNAMDMDEVSALDFATQLGEAFPELEWSHRLTRRHGSYGVTVHDPSRHARGEPA